jgi:hypothetical protein
VPGAGTGAMTQGRRDPGDGDGHSPRRGTHI